MRTRISTGEISNLKSYRRIALAISMNENSDVVRWFDEEISKAPNGEHEQVLAEESKMLSFIMEMIANENRPEESSVDGLGL